MKQKSKAAILLWGVLIAAIIFFVVYPKNDSLDHTVEIPTNQNVVAIEHAEQQVATALKNPDKVRLMECIGLNPGETRPGGWLPPTEKECAAVEQKLGAAAGVQETPTVFAPMASDIPPKIGRDGLAGGSADDIWQTIQSNGREIYVKTNGYYSGGVFRTYIVANLPESDVIGSPRSVMTIIEGGCGPKTFHVMGALYFSGKNRSGMAMENTPPEEVVRKLIPGSPLEAAFNLLCRNFQPKE